MRHGFYRNRKVWYINLDKFIVNIIHRPEMVPEYAEKVTGHGKEEDIGRKSLIQR